MNAPDDLFAEVEAKSISAHKELANAEQAVAQRASEGRAALEYFATATDTRNAGEYRDDLRAIIEAIDEWKAATQRVLEFHYTEGAK